MTRVTLDCGGEKRALRVLENNNTLPPSPCPSSTSTTTPNCSPSFFRRTRGPLRTATTFDTDFCLPQGDLYVTFCTNCANNFP